MKTIMITGPRGFLGKWLTNKLLNAGKYNIVLLSEDLTKPNLKFESICFNLTTPGTPVSLFIFKVNVLNLL